MGRYVSARGSVNWSSLVVPGLTWKNCGRRRSRHEAPWTSYLAEKDGARRLRLVGRDADAFRMLMRPIESYSEDEVRQLHPETYRHLQTNGPRESYS